LWDWSASHKHRGIRVRWSIIVGMDLGIVGLWWNESKGVILRLGRFRYVFIGRILVC
jgi:hypothetical protein